MAELQAGQGARAVQVLAGDLVPLLRLLLIYLARERLQGDLHAYCRLCTLG